MLKAAGQNRLHSRSICSVPGARCPTLNETPGFVDFVTDNYLSCQASKLFFVVVCLNKNLA